MTNRRLLAFWLLLGLAVACLVPPSAAGAETEGCTCRARPERPSPSVASSSGLHPLKSRSLSNRLRRRTRSTRTKMPRTVHGPWLRLRGTTFHVQGEATLDYLRSGLLVQLNAKVEGREIKEPIHELTITSKVHGTATRPLREASRLAKATGPAPRPRVGIGEDRRPTRPYPGGQVACPRGREKLSHRIGRRPQDQGFPVQRPHDQRRRQNRDSWRGDSRQAGRLYRQRRRGDSAQPLGAKSKPRPSEHASGSGPPKKTGSAETTGLPETQ